MEAPVSEDQTRQGVLLQGRDPYDTGTPVHNAKPMNPLEKKPGFRIFRSVIVSISWH